MRIAQESIGALVLAEEPGRERGIDAKLAQKLRKEDAFFGSVGQAKILGLKG